MEFLYYSISDPILLTLTAFIGGLFAGWIARRFLGSSGSMVLTIMFLPAVVCAALLAINGSLGAGIAILGVFGLVRFRSMPGSGTDLAAIFYAMVIGLMTSTGQIVMAIVITLLLGTLLIAAIRMTASVPARCTLHIMVPEDTEDMDVFEEIICKYARDVRMEKIRTTNMGSMYELVYTLIPDAAKTARMLDDIRIHNHNLNVALCRAPYENAL